MYCLNCSNVLSKRQKKFCSCKCMNTYNANLLGEQRRKETPDRYKTCLSCNQLLNLSKFSLVDKWNYAGDIKDTCKKCSAIQRETERRNRNWKHDAQKVLYSNAKQRAKREGIDFTIDKDDIIIPDNCPVFGFPLKRENKETWHSAPSLDRVDNTKGYVKGNVIVVSRRANILKKDATLTELKQLANYYEHLCG
jgi:hypothetical protein